MRRRLLTGLAGAVGVACGADDAPRVDQAGTGIMVQGDAASSDGATSTGGPAQPDPDPDDSSPPVSYDVGDGPKPRPAT